MAPEYSVPIFIDIYKLVVTANNRSLTSRISGKYNQHYDRH